MNSYAIGRNLQPHTGPVGVNEKLYWKMHINICCHNNYVFELHHSYFCSGWHGEETCDFDESTIDRWVSLGASWIGGCCRVKSIRIKKLREIMEKHKK